MEKEEHGLITFHTTHFAIQAERLFRKNELKFKTIPTPRIVSYSCGLALLFSLDELERVRGIIVNKQINIKNIYKYTKEGQKGSAVKLTISP